PSIKRISGERRMANKVALIINVTGQGRRLSRRIAAKQEIGGPRYRAALPTVNTGPVDHYYRDFYGPDARASLWRFSDCTSGSGLLQVRSAKILQHGAPSAPCGDPAWQQTAWLS